ncbi:autotransporter outer membrane beta-barrel domain-containing protein [Edaphosphingomonas haloaromaticamans]|uniref:Autotransporter beta-domain protein n=1 Tax=Edaphosphingomonas haloaromaticamans TaxID=653954 RepID=A0A1S1H7J7_9SPHN|nr:autotransporter outer membrane beta-barrel domain-containing protein [Sphingomonas haloaromaticamans]OHT18067.1 Autotransporter beta-domain protein [Sphingomonas haloaromaticamans]
MRSLLATTCLTPLGLLILAAPVQAETTIGDKRTAGVATATVNSGAADDIKISSAGSIVPTASGAAVTVNSANKVTNEGAITFSDVNDATGILINDGMTTTITNSGKITIDETYAPTDTDKDGDLDGPLAQGSNRFAIRTAGAMTGNIVNGGTIAIEGNNSGGIVLGGTLTGSLTNSGSINVIGDNGYGIRARDVSGDVRVQGAINVQGANSVGLAVDGNVGGAMVVQGAITATGYRSTSVSDPSKLDADDLLQGGPAVRVAGNVAGGIVFAAPPKDTNPDDKDEDKDGIEDSKEGTAAITSYGSAAAVEIGSAAQDVAIGAVAGNANGHGLVVEGAIAGNGVFAGIDGNAMVIGGQGKAVTIAGGMTVSGTITATGAGAGSSATGLRIGSGATVAEIRNSGGIGAGSGTGAEGKATAIRIDAGANVGTIRNSGQIKASAGSADGAATAIVDKAGTVTLVENSGSIVATGALATSDRNVAIDLSANNGGTTVKQIAAAQGAAAPAIQGDILFGAGSDTLDIADGAVSGTTRFGTGANRLQLSGDAAYAGKAEFGAGNDVMALSGTSIFSGTADFGGGTDSLTLSDTARFSGTLAGSQGLAVNVAGGTLDLANTGTVALASLNVGGTGAIRVNVDGAAGTGTLYQVAGDASFAAGSKVVVKLANVSDSEGVYTFLRAGSVTGGDQLASADTALPYMFKSSVVAGANTNELAIDIQRKNATELGLNRSQAAAYDAVFKVLDKDAKIAGAFLDIADGGRFRRQLRQMLPDHAGGTFEAVTSGSRASARMLADPRAPFADQGGWGFWLQQVAWGTSKSLGDTASYDITGWGASGGAEAKTDGFGNFGVSLAYLYGKDADGGTDNEVQSNQFELAGYWRADFGALHTFARASGAYVKFKGRRDFAGTFGDEEVTRQTRGKWNGTLFSAAGGASYEMQFGRVSVRPVGSIDYYRLHEKGYDETGGGDAFNLIVDSRTSDEFAANGTVAVGLNFGGKDPDAGWFRTEIEGGRRQIIGGKLGSTTARFRDGEAFTLVPEDRTNGWVGRLRLLGGNSGFTAGGELSAEEQQGHAAIAFRASINIGF